MNIFLLTKMQHMTKIKTALRIILYIYLFIMASSLLFHTIVFGYDLVNLLFLIPLMVFSSIYGIWNFNKTMTR
jgi:hypothetical protein